MVEVSRAYNELYGGFGKSDTHSTDRVQEGQRKTMHNILNELE